MKHLLLISLVLSYTINAKAQQNWCGTDNIQNKLKAENPGYAEHIHKSMSKASMGGSAINKAVLNIPVVVHIIHDNGVGNISVEQVEDALRILNEDYNRLNADAIQTRNTAEAPFVPIAGDMNVQFKLAKKDPDGNCTNGIVRVNAPELSNNADDNCKYDVNGGSDQWPMDQYLNIWVVNSIASDGAGITLGYAYLPYWPNGANYGILIRHDSFGTTGTASGSDGRTLTHEMGHLLGLQHIFDPGWDGDTGCHDTDCSDNGDYCCDTPPQTEANWSCSMIWNSCDLIPVNDAFGFDAVDQIENYMSYNACQNMFSIDQVGIMQQNFLDIDFLANMVSVANVAATGINDPEVLCKAEFEASKTAVCANETILLTDYSFHNVSSWNWSISPGVEGTDWMFTAGTDANDQNPQIQFINQGFYTINLTVSDGTDSDSEIKSNYISVLPNYFTLPFWEGFEAYTTLVNNPNWVVVNPGENNEFTIVDGVSFSGTKCAKLQNYAQSGNNTDELISAPIDLSVLNPDTEQVTLSFRYSYRKRVASNDEWLKVFISGDCGNNWVQRKTLHGDLLSSLTSAISWVPASQSDWTTVHMTNVTSAYFTSDFRMKFRFEGDNGNNFYLDDINLYKGSPSDDLVLGLSGGDDISGISLYPNPGDDELNIRFDMNAAQQAAIIFQDLSGKIVQSSMINAEAGANLVLLNTANLAAGSYLVTVKTGSAEKVMQFVVK